jgi:hypothetical protein
MGSGLARTATTKERDDARHTTAPVGVLLTNDPVGLFMHGCVGGSWRRCWPHAERIDAEEGPRSRQWHEEDVGDTQRGQERRLETGDRVLDARVDRQRLGAVLVITPQAWPVRVPIADVLDGAGEITMMRRSAGRESPRSPAPIAVKGRRQLLRAVVVAALGIGATQIPLVSAYAGRADHQPAMRGSADARFYMQPTESRTTVCTGDSATYRIAVYVAVGGLTPGTVTSDMNGVRVEGYVNDAALGTLKPAAATTADFAGGVSTADFVFKAGKKPGKTTLVFQGAVKGQDIHVGYVSFKIPIRVIDCKFRVSGTLRFPADSAISPVPGPPLVAIIKPQQLTADTDGHLSGSATIHWNNASVSAGIGPLQCTAREKFGADDQVIVNGDVSDDGILTLTFEFPEANGVITTSCAGLATPPQPFPYIVHKVTVRIATKGGTIRAPATYKDTGTGGSATIVVKKVKT